MEGGVLGRVVMCVMAVLAVAVLSCPMALGAPAVGAAWNISMVAQPTNLVPTHHHSGEPADQYVLVLTNTGSMTSAGSVALTDTLPVGVAVGGSIASPGWECPTGIGSTVVTCTYSGAVPALGQSPVLTIPVAVTGTGVLTNRVMVSGGGAPVDAAERSTDAGGPIPSFGFLDFSSQSSDVSGAPDTQAGDHPAALITILDLPQREVVSGNPEKPIQIPKTMAVDLPAGLVGDPQAASQCTIVELTAHHSCKPSSRVGTILVNLAQGFFQEHSAFPIFNVIPEHGHPAEFGAYVEGLEKVVFMYGSVGPPPGYRLRLSVPDIPYAGEATNAIVTFFGDPTRMDGEGSSTPFFTNSSDCSGEPLTTSIEASTWEEPGHSVSAEAQALPVAGCDLLQFQPSLSFAPESPLADEPSGYTFDLKVPQSPPAGLEGLATPPIKNTKVTLPPGVSISPSAADGLVACPAEGPEGIDLSSTETGHCPLASQVGTVEAVTPLLAEPLQGHVYVALPGCGGAGQGPCTEADALDGNLFGVFMQLEGSGVVIKLHGTVSANPATGQLTASFRETPQQPFSDLKVTFKSGPRAPLANPQTCGEAIMTADITPWSSPETPDANPISPFSVTGCGGPSFAPTFEAGTTSTNAGAYTNFSATFGRSDRMQDLGAIQVQTPPGLLGTLAHVTLCEEPQAAKGTCSSASRIGTATGAAGAGSHPFWVSGPVYLTGPYKGAPFGLSVALPAVAGPFNLGTVVVRSALNIDPATSALTITSDPLPQILDGVPLRVQTVNVTVDRPQFMFNPTNCEAKQITAKIASAQGAVAQVSSPFAAGGCKNLAFNPKLTASSRADASKKNGASLVIKVTYGGGQANIHGVTLSFPKQLPARLTTLQKACPDTTFNTNPATCPAGSVIGISKASTPVLPVPLTGPVYLVSHGGAAFPDVDLVLQGEGVRVDVTGRTSIKHGVTTSTIPNAPDAPISSFEVRLPQGPNSAFSANGSLCAKPLKMPTTLVGQNGRKLVRTTKVTVAGCPKVAKKAKKATAKGRAKAGSAHRAARPRIAKAVSGR